MNLTKTKFALSLPYEMPSALCTALQKLYEQTTGCKLQFDSESPSVSNTHEWLTISFLVDHSAVDGFVEQTNINFNRESTYVGDEDCFDPRTWQK